MGVIAARGFATLAAPLLVATADIISAETNAVTVKG
jgi:hypothetical protein